MRPVRERLPRATPLHFDPNVLRSLEDRFSNLVIKRPVPTDLSGHVGAQVDGMSGQVPRIHGLRRASSDELLLPRQGPTTLQDGKVDGGYLNCPVDDLDQVGMDAREPLPAPRANREFAHGPALFWMPHACSGGRAIKRTDRYSRPMNFAKGIAALILGVLVAAGFGILAGFAIGALVLVAPIAWAYDAIRKRLPRHEPKPN